MPSRGQQLGKLLNSSGDIVETSLPPKIETFSQSVSNTGKIEVAALGDDVSTIEQVSDTNSLSASGNTAGDQRIVGNSLYIWNGTGWYRIALINQTPTWDSGGQPSTSYILDADSPQDATVITLAASDPDGLPVSYSYVTSGSMDSMATISQDSSVFTITPKTVAQVGEGVELTGSITFRASDGVNILPHVSSFTLSFVTSVENSKYTTLLVTAIDTSDNNNITDSSSSNHTITVTGDAHAGTFSPYRHGGYSTFFNYASYGSGTIGLRPTSTTEPAYGGSGDLTVELWIYPTIESNNTYTCILDQRPAGLNGNWIMIRRNADGTILFHFSGSWRITTSANAAPANEWTHIAIVRSSGVFTMYINGTAEPTTYTNSGAINNNSGSLKPYIGLQNSNTQPFWGYIRDVRFVSSSVYTQNFTPLEKLTAIVGTTFLTCHKPYQLVYDTDSTTNIKMETYSQSVEAGSIGPYDYDEYSAADHGGAVYFDGSGDVIYTSQDTAFNFGTADFTFEAWVYPTLYTSDWNTLFAIGNSTNFGGLLVGKSNAGSFVIRQYGTANIVSTTTLPDLNTWTHIACVRSSGTSKLYYNGSEIATASDTTNYSSTTPFAHIGNSDHTSYSHYWNGYVSDARFISGTAVYSGAFTPPIGPLTTTGGTYPSTTNVDTNITASNTKLLTKGTDASIIDKSQSSNLKLVGNTTGSTTQVKFANTKSMYFDGTGLTGDYLTTGYDSSLVLGTGSLTVELWYYLSNTQTHTIFELHDGYPNGSGTLYTNNRAKMVITSTKILLNDGTANIGDYAETQVINQWRHWAWSRDASGNNRFYLNGTQIGTTVSSSNNLITPVVDLGRRAETNTSFMQGYIQDFRVTKGLARYTTNFTPPTAPLKG